MLTRTAPIVGRGLTALGATAVAYGAARSRIPRKKRPFTVVPKKEAKRLGRYKKGRYIHYRPETVWNRLPQIDVQERRARRAHLKPRIGPTVLKGAGSIMIVGGRALPVIAYGYVAGDLLFRIRRGEKVDVEEEIYTTTFGMTREQHQQHMADTATAIQTAYHLGAPIMKMAWRLA